MEDHSKIALALHLSDALLADHPVMKLLFLNALVCPNLIAQTVSWERSYKNTTKRAELWPKKTLRPITNWPLKVF